MYQSIEYSHSVSHSHSQSNAHRSFALMFTCMHTTIARVIVCVHLRAHNHRSCHRLSECHDFSTDGVMVPRKTKMVMPRARAPDTCPRDRPDVGGSSTNKGCRYSIMHNATPLAKPAISRLLSSESSSSQPADAFACGTRSCAKALAPGGRRSVSRSSSCSGTKAVDSDRRGDAASVVRSSVAEKSAGFELNRSSVSASSRIGDARRRDGLFHENGDSMCSVTRGGGCCCCDDGAVAFGLRDISLLELGAPLWFIGAALRKNGIR